MNSLIPMQFENANIRVVTDEAGEPWFVGKDVCEALGYANPTDAMNQHCRGVAKRYPIVDALGRNQEARILSEPDVLRLIVRSTLPAADRFERWVFEEVLPTIRRTGGYSAPGAKPSRPASHLGFIGGEMRGAMLLAKLVGLTGNQAILSASMAVQKVHGVNPLALLDSTHLVNPKQERICTASELGAEFNESPIAFNKRLEAAGLQEKPVKGGPWVPTEKGKPYAVIMDAGKQHNSGAMIQQMKWYESVLDVLTAPPRNEGGTLQ